MTTNEQLDHAIAILQAKRDGKAIQTPFDDEWVTENLTLPEVIRALGKLRIKPEPRVWYIRAYADDSFGNFHKREDPAKSFDMSNYKIIRVIEDLSYSPGGEV